MSEIIQKAKEVLDDKIVPIKEALVKVDLTPISTGIKSLDDLMTYKRKGVAQDTGGFRRGDFIILSAHSGHGKSVIGLNFIHNMLKQGSTAMLFSYEMIINFSFDKLEDMGVTDEEFGRLLVSKELKKNDIEWVLNKMDEAIEEYNTVFFVIDQLDFISTKSSDAGNRREEIGLILEQLITFAKEKKVIIMLQAQVTKNEKFIDKPLRAYMLADSRKLKNDPNYIIFAMRDTDNGLAVGNGGILRLAKNRLNGENGDMRYYLNECNNLIEGEDYNY